MAAQQIIGGRGRQRLVLLRCQHRETVPRLESDHQIRLELANAPEGISLTNVSISQFGLELVFACDSEKGKPGATGNLICDVVPKNQGEATPQKKKRQPAPQRFRGHATGHPIHHRGGMTWLLLVRTGMRGNFTPPACAGGGADG